MDHAMEDINVFFCRECAWPCHEEAVPSKFTLLLWSTCDRAILYNMLPFFSYMVIGTYFPSIGLRASVVLGIR